MQPEAPQPSENSQPAKGLPPVAPPSGRFIAQLFLVPGLIVAVAVLIYLGSSYLVRSSHTPESFLKELDSVNPEIRWRGAHDLAQVLKRPESLKLASDPKFALDLAERLDKALAEVEKEEKASLEDIEKEVKKRGKELTQGERDAVWRKLANQRNHVLFLIACMGDFTIPVGAPLLGEVALKDTGAEIKGVTLRRRRAVWALANLGDNFKRRYLGERSETPKPDEKVLSAEQKAAIIAELQDEVKQGGKRAEWARAALRPLQGQPSGVDAVLERCASADDPYLRSLIAHALNFWDGDRVEPTLLRLARDDGHGKILEITETD
ncbi:MAG TPA: hypothetical protein VEL76_14845 [Gemmataceae bacterium]|nr:hypothetical protein [Gemmataceae bacterium]